MQELRKYTPRGEKNLKLRLSTSHSLPLLPQPRSPPAEGLQKCENSEPNDSAICLPVLRTQIGSRNSPPKAGNNEETSSSSSFSSFLLLLNVFCCCRGLIKGHPGDVGADAL